jgi:hypothetical protein
MRAIHLPAATTTAALAAIATVPLTVAGAAAAPAGDLIQLVCGGATYSVLVNGNGDFTPARDTASTTVFVPTSFFDSSYVITDSSGNIVDQGTDDTVVTKGRSDKARGTAVTCSFSVSDVFEDPELGQLTGTFSGMVTGFTTPAR